MWMIILEVLLGLSVVANIVLLLVIRGIFKIDEEERDHMTFRALNGREIEAMRRKLVSVGMSGISLNDALNLVKTLREIQVGVYKDTDPYIPADPYEDIDFWREGEK